MRDGLEKNYLLLAAELVATSVENIRAANKKLKKNADNEKAQETKELELEFLNSPFGELCINSVSDAVTKEEVIAAALA